MSKRKSKLHNAIYISKKNDARVEYAQTVRGVTYTIFRKVKGKHNTYEKVPVRGVGARLLDLGLQSVPNLMHGIETIDEEYELFISPKFNLPSDDDIIQ